jgi:hypothetical protein
MDLLIVERKGEHDRRVGPSVKYRVQAKGGCMVCQWWIKPTQMMRRGTYKTEGMAGNANDIQWQHSLANF